VSAISHGARRNSGGNVVHTLENPPKYP
jgi:hypothetical protein